MANKEDDVLSLSSSFNAFKMSDEVHRVSLDDLPYEVKCHLMLALPLEDRKTMRLVSKTWKDCFKLTKNEIAVIKDPRDLPDFSINCENMKIELCDLWYDLSNYVSPMNGGWTINGSSIRYLKIEMNGGKTICPKIILYFTHMQSLFIDLGSIHKEVLTENAICNAILKCEFLEVLHLRVFSVKSKIDFLKQLARKIHPIRELFLFDGFAYSATDLEPIISNFGRNLSGFGFDIQDDHVLHLIQSHLPNIKKLRLIISPSCSNKAVLDLLQGLQLTHLKIVNHYDLSENRNLRLPKGVCSKLEALSFINLPLVGLEHMINLQYLNLKKYDSLGDDAFTISEMYNISKMAKLRTLQIGYAEQKLLFSLQSLKSLRHLYIRNLYIEDFSQLNRLTELTRLRVFDVNNIKITKNALWTSLENLALPKLEILEFECTNAVNLEILSKNCPSLKKVFLNRISQTVPDEIKFKVYCEMDLYSIRDRWPWAEECGEMGAAIWG